MATVMKRNTIQKRTVLSVVNSMHNHPTAEEVFVKAREILPSISLATVYRILREAAIEKLILEVPDESEHFDFNTKPHAHFICDECHSVYDVMINVADLKANIPGEVKSSFLTFHGVCNECKKYLPKVNIIK